jgi:hypothetical protein
MHEKVRLHSLLPFLLILCQSASALSWGRLDQASLKRRSGKKHAVHASVVLQNGQHKAVPGHADGAKAALCETMSSIFDKSCPFPPSLRTIAVAMRSAGALCTGSFTDSVHTRSGFGVLHLHASPKAADAHRRAHL